MPTRLSTATSRTRAGPEPRMGDPEVETEVGERFTVGDVVYDRTTPSQTRPLSCGYRTRARRRGSPPTERRSPRIIRRMPRRCRWLWWCLSVQWRPSCRRGSTDTAGGERARGRGARYYSFPVPRLIHHSAHPRSVEEMANETDKRAPKTDAEGDESKRCGLRRWPSG